MAPRPSNPGRLRPLALAVAVATALLTPAGLSAQAAGDDAVSPVSDPAVAPEAPGTTESAVPLASPPSEAQPSAPAPPATVTVARASASASKSVSIVDFSFDPGTVTVSAGDTVKWTNDGSVPEGHDVTGDGLDSGTMHSGDSYSHTFNSSGTFSYICTIHPSMKGTVKVLARSSGSSGGRAGSGDSGGGSGGGSSGTSTATGSDPAAVSSPGLGGSATSLPATGSDPLGLATLGLVLLNLGVALRVAGGLRGRPGS
jgi:plastocyanin